MYSHSTKLCTDSNVGTGGTGSYSGSRRTGRLGLACVRLSGHIQPHSKQLRLGQVRLGYVRLGQVRLGQVRLGQVRLG